MYRSNDGDVFQGQFREGLPHGVGEYLYGELLFDPLILKWDLEEPGL